MKVLNKDNPKALSYRIVTGEQWGKTFKAKYPHAAHNVYKTEYILSCNDDSGKLTRKEAQTYIGVNWQQEVTP